jgi:hypothetical protein
MHRTDQALCKGQNGLQYRDTKRNDECKYLQQKVEYELQNAVNCVHKPSVA